VGLCICGRDETLDLLNVQEGHRILDVGCGTGDDVRRLASLVGSTGCAVGVDNSKTMITEAERRSEGLNLAVEFHVNDAQHLDFADSTFDGCRAERIFVHVEDPGKLLIEMIRVARPGGRVVVFECDVDALIFDTPDRALDRKVVHAICDSLRHGRIARQLPALFRRSALEEIIVVPRLLIIPWAIWAKALVGTLKNAQEAGVLTGGDISNWWNQVEEAEQSGVFFSAVPAVLVSGRKPQEH
jgi:ubiquinone/menaquinone biosynthesis C-methylase UbiE